MSGGWHPQGVIVALVTPLGADGTVVEPDVARLVASVRPHVNALLPALSTGEGWALSEAQWTAMVSATVAHADGVPVLAGIQLPTTAETLARVRLAARLGARAVVVTTPYGSGVTQEEMYQHLAAVTEAATIPVILYHESAVSGNSLELSTLLRACALPGVVAVKDSGGSLEFTRQLVAARPGVPVFQGLEHLLPESGGVDGWVLALANVEPELCAAYFADRSAQQADQLSAACDRYGLSGPDWYRTLKVELHRRGILTSDRLAQVEGVPV